MLDEACVNALIEDLNSQDVEISYGGGQKKTITITSARAKPMSNVEQETRVTVEFMDTQGTPKSLSGIASHDPDTNVITFGFEEVTQVDVRISSKAKKHGVRHINPKTITAAIMDMVVRRVLKYWNSILKLYNGSIVWERGYSQQDLTPFVQADNRSVRQFRFWVKHEFTYNMLDTDETSFYTETTRILWYLYDVESLGDEDLSIVHEDMYD